MTTYKIGAEWQDALFNVLAPGIIERHYTAGVTLSRPNGNDFSVVLMVAPEKSVKGSNMFDPTQALELKMNQFELEFSYQF